LSSFYHQIVAVPLVSTQPIKIGYALFDESNHVDKIEKNIKSVMPNFVIHKVLSVNLRSER